MYKNLIMASLLLTTGCVPNSNIPISNNAAASSTVAPVAPPTPFNDGFFEQNFSSTAGQGANQAYDVPPGFGDLPQTGEMPLGAGVPHGFDLPQDNNSQAFNLYNDADQLIQPDAYSSGNDALNADIRHSAMTPPYFPDPSTSGSSMHDPLYPPNVSPGRVADEPLIIVKNQPLKQTLENYVNPHGYRLIWDTPYDVYFENDVVYENVSLMKVLESVANDLNAMAVDIHMNVYLKNKVILVYSVRK